MSIYFFYDSSEPVPFSYLTPTRMVGELPPPYETSTSPNIYLEYAIADFADGSQRGLVNSFGNAKRALHFTIDVLLNQYGLFRHFGKSNFPTKLQLLDDIGILPITIMRNLNVERNLVEHDYDTPSKQRVAEAIDVVKLLLLATEKLLESTPCEAVVGWRSPKRHTLLQLEPSAGEIRLFTLQAKGRYRKSHGITHFSGPLRFFAENKLTPGIKVGKVPWRTINLNRAEVNDWKPIIAELVNIQRKSNARQSVLDSGSATVTIPITVPVSSFGSTSLAQIVDGMISKRFEDEKNKRAKESENRTEVGSEIPSETNQAPESAA